MTNELAVEWLKDHVKTGRMLIKNNYIVDKDFDCFEKASEKAIEALEKQIPKKFLDWDEYKCPNCKNDLYMYHQSTSEVISFCCICGQAIDWSDIDEYGT